MFTIVKRAINKMKKLLRDGIIKLGTKLNNIGRSVFVVFESIFSIKQDKEKIKRIEDEIKCLNADARLQTEIEKTFTELPPVAESIGQELRDISRTGKDRNWSERKKQNLQLAKLFEQARKKDKTIITAGRLQDLRDCANILMFAQDAMGRQKLARAYFCRNRFCNICCWRRSLKLYGQTSAAADWIIREKPDTRFLFITFTQKNCKGEELAAELNKMQKCCAVLTDKKQKTDSPFVLQFRKISRGYIRSMEITYNSKTNTFHPHIHFIFAVGKQYFKREDNSGYITQSNWRNLWRELMGLDYLPQVCAKAVPVKGQKKAVAELTKYPAKPSDLLEVKNRSLAVNAVITLVKATKKKRFVSYGGIFRTARTALKLEDVEAQKANLLAINPDKEYFNAVAYVMYKYNVKLGVYIN